MSRLLALLLLLFSTGVAWADADLLQTLRDAESRSTAKAVVRKLERALPKSPEARLSQLQFTVETLAARDWHDLAAELLQRWRGKLGEPVAECVLERRRAEALLELGRHDEALLAVESAAAWAGKLDRDGVARSLLGELDGLRARTYEASGRHAEALDAYQAWRRDFRCGVGRETFELERGRGVARMMFETGRVDEALVELSRLSTAWLGDGLSYDTGAAAIEFGRYSERAGRLAAALDDAASIEPAHALDWRRLVEAGGALQRGELGRALALADEGRDDETLPGAGAHARTTVPYAIAASIPGDADGLAAAVASSIVAGNRTATLLAIEHSWPGTRDALRKRLRVETDDAWRSWLESLSDD